MKKEQSRTKTGFAEKDVKSNKQPRPPGFDRFESFGHDKFTAKHCYFRFSRSPDVDGRIKMTRPQNIKLKEQCCFVVRSSLSKILIPSTLEGLEHLK